ncbi:uncharacterized protein TrAFT101_000361 [Trichoderma asperellum]|uniref:uncharacterized protein n=1 Tax=Trichoderma asperellum TaxID=101201 RepID=UPI003329A978|nr:hypothetical protein TrAFT101_000361 [Trichoderma asperellum]
MSHNHPFDPIRPDEISLATTILKASLPGVNLRFKVIDVKEPIKKDVIPYIEAERTGQPLPRHLHACYTATYTDWTPMRSSRPSST